MLHCQANPYRAKHGPVSPKLMQLSSLLSGPRNADVCIVKSSPKGMPSTRANDCPCLAGGAMPRHHAPGAASPPPPAGLGTLAYPSCGCKSRLSHAMPESSRATLCPHTRLLPPQPRPGAAGGLPLLVVKEDKA
jgi:hypothetical protein